MYDLNNDYLYRIQFIFSIVNITEMSDECHVRIWCAWLHMALNCTQDYTFIYIYIPKRAHKQVCNVNVWKPYQNVTSYIFVPARFVTEFCEPFLPSLWDFTVLSQ